MISTQNQYRVVETINKVDPIRTKLTLEDLLFPVWHLCLNEESWSSNGCIQCVNCTALIGKLKPLRVLKKSKQFSFCQESYYPNINRANDSSSSIKKFKVLGYTRLKRGIQLEEGLSTQYERVSWWEHRDVFSIFEMGVWYFTKFKVSLWRIMLCE